ncbi:MAG: hypothetical protein ACK54J_02840 [Pseudanabaena sp.]
MAELRSDIFWVLNCPIYLLRCYRVTVLNSLGQYLSNKHITKRSLFA